MELNLADFYSYSTNDTDWTPAIMAAQRSAPLNGALTINLESRTYPCLSQVDIIRELVLKSDGGRSATEATLEFDGCPGLVCYYPGTYVDPTNGDICGSYLRAKDLTLRGINQNVAPAQSDTIDVASFASPADPIAHAITDIAGDYKITFTIDGTVTDFNANIPADAIDSNALATFLANAINLAALGPTVVAAGSTLTFTNGGPIPWYVCSGIFVDTATSTLVALYGRTVVHAPHGLRSFSTFRTGDIFIDGFGACGVAVIADNTSGTPMLSAANGWSMRDGFYRLNGGAGVFVKGGDANTGYCSKLNVEQNLGYGYDDQSFLGGTWIMCEEAFDAEGSYRTIAGGCESLFLGCYSEGPVPHDISHPSVVIAGVMTPNAANPSPAVCLTVQQFGASITPLLSQINANDATDIVTTNVPSRPVRVPLSFSSSAEQAGGGANDWELAHDDVTVNTRWWRLRFGNDAVTAALLADALTNPAQFGLTPGTMWFSQPRTLYTPNAQSVEWGNAAPVAASHFSTVGDIVWNNAPGVGQPMGWMCTVTGSPGTWVAMPNL